MVAKIRQRVHAKSSEVQAPPRRGLRRPLNSKTYFFYGVFVLGIVLTATVLALYFLDVFTPARLAYAIMFDAGSTGSRIHIFQIRVQNGEYKLDNETYDRVSPGLSDYATHPKDGALSLKPLLDKALVIVPEADYRYTELSLKATAGLRLLPELQQLQLMSEVRKFFAKYPFRSDKSSVDIMDGTHEGFYGWLTVVFLLGRDLFSNNIAALDLGGGSTQITFIPEESTTFNMTDHMHRMKMPGGSHIDVYTNSYLGGGLMYGRTEILKKSKTFENQSLYLIESPCIHPEAGGDGDLYWQYYDYNYTVRPHPEGHFNFLHCYENAREVIQETRIFKPKELSSRDMFLMSYYYDRAVDTGLIEDGDDGKLLQVGDFKKRAQHECQHRSQGLILNEFLCTDLTYVYALLHDGLGLPDSAYIWVVKKLRGSEVSWALGAALSGIHL
ncbi:ectonucleoside triphosphate diphosphohydrolase 5 [Galendromus occidentalis]|uniref:Ectonucleoside triphosphate diphosphohydrolase 5 n=1 Tax=Galendromus occidentalis TaxID=34638 RepID=A0AAJ6QN25_9ACAR|nr:ectonucleoside triphosphate diphosphohydrolase 5 [Galendromus occidentalis]